MALIGIIDTAHSEIHEIMITPYCKAIKGCGAQYKLLQWTTDPLKLDSYIQSCDGFIFTGGDDIAPEKYGESAIPECGKTLSDRDDFEFSFLPLVLEAGKPVLGICRGCQMINVAFGGSLWQDIPTQTSNTLCHSPSPVELIAQRTHEVVVVQNTKLSSILRSNKLIENSMHHQGIKDLGVGLTLSAVSIDGIPEGIELQGHPFFVAVQWHPEWLYPDEDSTLLFSSFVRACEV